jgi:hypothetical protein
MEEVGEMADLEGSNGQEEVYLFSFYLILLLF